MSSNQLPIAATWDICDACQLRCTYCYSEAGRRKERRLSTEALLRVADVLTSMPLISVQISGGEPTLVHDLPLLIQRLRTTISKVQVFTNAHDLSPEMAGALLDHATDIHVSLDGPEPAVNDPVRGVPGAFRETLAGLRLLNDMALERRKNNRACARLGIDIVVVRSNLRGLKAMCADIITCYPALSFLLAGAAVPSGLASEPAFAQQELLREDDLAELQSPSLLAELRALAPGLARIELSDNLGLLFSPERIAAGQALTVLMHIEANGQVRAIPTCEGTVGDLLTEPVGTIWQRARERWNHPYVRRQLAGVQTMQAWAAASRAIDRYFASRDDLLRLGRRAAPRESEHEIAR